MTMTDYGDDQLRTWADSVASQVYYDARARGQDAETAQAAAKFAWQQKIDEATQTGMWNGAYNMPSQQNFATMFGTWMPQGPQAGQQTLTAEQQAYQQAFNNSQMYGQYYAPGSTPTAGTQTQQAINQQNQLGIAQAGLTGYYAAPGTTGQGQQTMQGQQQQWSQGFQQQQEANRVQQSQQQNTQAYLQLLASLRGPADWAKYQQVLGSTPGGLRDLYAAAAGQYVPGGGATTGMAPQPVSLQSMVGDVNGQGYGGTGAPLTMPGQPQQQYAQGMTQGPGSIGGGYTPPQGYAQASYGQPQTQAWGSGIGVGQQQATPQQQAQGMGNGTNLPAPNQIAAQSWKNMAPSQQQMLLGQYENQGWDKNDVQSLMNQNLPKYGTNAASAGTWRLGQ